MYDDYSNNAIYTIGSNTGSGLLVGIGAGLWVFSAAISIFMIVCTWKIYKKAGKPGWASIIPIYNIIVLLEIVELPKWYIALLIVPFANIYAMFKIYIELAHKFGKSTGFGVLMVFFNVICLPILAFGKNEYKDNNNSNEKEVTPENNELPQTFSSEQNNVNDISDVNNINMNTRDNSMAATGFVPVGNLNNNIENQNRNNDSLNKPEQNKEVVNIPASPIPNVEPVISPVSVNGPIQTIANTTPEVQTLNNLSASPVLNSEPTLNNSIDNQQSQQVEQNNINSAPNNNQTIFTNMDNNTNNN